ncbi:MAG: pyridoxamine 5'-phosphate oxidase family protein [Planctomycetota bacterium]|nr:pyridoxamine 5'-phosphate oxidase family protein [Planctomycetota bacterium]
MTTPRSTDLAFTPAVKSIQTRLGSRSIYEGVERRGGFQTEITQDLARFIAARDSLYLGTASADGRPYIQHRGGPKGFLKVIDERTLAFADFSGNRQYLSMGNLSENDQAFLFLMDYAQKKRMKLWGRARFVEDDPALLAAVSDPAYRATPERVLVFELEAWDANCPQHIPRLFTEDEVAERERVLRARIAELEGAQASSA